MLVFLAQQFWFFYMVYTAEGKKLSFVKWFYVFMLLSCIFKQFFCAERVDVKQGGGQISNVESMYEACVAQWVWMAPQKQKYFMDNLPKFCLSRIGHTLPKVYSFSPFFAGQNLPSESTQNIAKSKNFSKNYILRNIN